MLKCIQGVHAKVNEVRTRRADNPEKTSLYDFKKGIHNSIGIRRRFSPCLQAVMHDLVRLLEDIYTGSSVNNIDRRF
jgi:hypothetical protein